MRLDDFVRVPIAVHKPPIVGRRVLLLASNCDDGTAQDGRDTTFGICEFAERLLDNNFDPSFAESVCVPIKKVSDKLACCKIGEVCARLFIYSKINQNECYRYYKLEDALVKFLRAEEEALIAYINRPPLRIMDQWIFSFKLMKQLYLGQTNEK